MRRYFTTCFTTLLLGVSMCAPVALQAKDKEDHHEKRYYDRYRKDYHHWNEQEERAYRHWLQEERRREYHPWAHAKHKEQEEYWRWRHDHPDWR